MSHLNGDRRISVPDLWNSRVPGNALISPTDSEVFNEWTRFDPESEYRRQASIAAISLNKVDLFLNISAVRA